MDFSGGACSGADLNIFFPPGRGRPKTNPEWEKYCHVCKIRLECLKYALVHDEKGIWGGLTEKERSRIQETQPDLIEHYRKEAIREGWYSPNYFLDEVIALMGERRDILQNWIPPKELMHVEVQVMTVLDIQEIQDQPEAPEQQNLAAFEFYLDAEIALVPQPEPFLFDFEIAEPAQKTVLAPEWPFDQ